jgi:DNA polymerase III subunit epsilon
MNSDTPYNKPVKHVLVFDTETTGKYNKKVRNIDEQPYVTQLSYTIYNVETQTIKTHYNEYIKIPDHVVISEEVTNISGITREICDTKGILIEEALQSFYQAYHRCDLIVAHNYEFDSTMMTIEYARHQEFLKGLCPNGRRLFHFEYMQERSIGKLCTMKSATTLCKLPPKTPRKYPPKSEQDKYKWPSLQELYGFLFPNDEAIVGYHNAMVDVLATLKCYMKLQYNVHITHEKVQECIELMV